VLQLKVFEMLVWTRAVMDKKGIEEIMTLVGKGGLLQRIMKEKELMIDRGNHVLKIFAAKNGMMDD